MFSSIAGSFFDLIWWDGNHMVKMVVTTYPVLCESLGEQLKLKKLYDTSAFSVFLSLLNSLPFLASQFDFFGSIFGVTFEDYYCQTFQKLTGLSGGQSRFDKQILRLSVHFFWKSKMLLIIGLPFQNVNMEIWGTQPNFYFITAWGNSVSLREFLQLQI